MSSVIVSLDLGTTGNRALAFNEEGQLIAQSYQELPNIFQNQGGLNITLKKSSIAHSVF